MNQKPLTAQDLAEALGCFSNAAIGAMHNGTHAVACIAQGVDAVVWRLQEIAESGKPAPAPSVAAPADLLAAARITELEAEVKRLREALRPFAEAPPCSDTQAHFVLIETTGAFHFFQGDFDRARTALSPTEEA